MAGARGSHGGKGQSGKGQSGKGQSGKRPGGKRPNPASGRLAAKPTRAVRPSRPAPAFDERAPEPPAGPFRLGAVPGTTPGKWIDTWHARLPQTALELVALPVSAQRDAVLGDAASGGAVRGRTVDAALVRLPLDRGGLHVIPLYDEVPVVVCAVDSHLTAADELTADDLAGEVVIVPRDAVIEADVPGAVTPAFAAPETTEEAVATVAAGVGVVIVPMSLARLHHRKDVAHRPLADGPTSTVALAWPTEDHSPLVDTFVGIVRGRTANSSRD